MLSVRSNLAAVASAGSLRRTQSSLGSALGRISSGRRVERAADDAAGLGVATNLESQRLGLTSAASGIMDADIAEESSRLASLQIIQSAGFASLGQAKDLQESVLNLL